MSGQHGVYLDSDEDGFYTPRCECGWVGFPAPDPETAADMYGDHRARVAIEAMP